MLPDDILFLLFDEFVDLKTYGLFRLSCQRLRAHCARLAYYQMLLVESGRPSNYDNFDSDTYFRRVVFPRRGALMRNVQLLIHSQQWYRGMGLFPTVMFSREVVPARSPMRGVYVELQHSVLQLSLNYGGYGCFTIRVDRAMGAMSYSCVGTPLVHLGPWIPLLFADEH